jgi:hypothetical protein
MEHSSAMRTLELLSRPPGFEHMQMLFLSNLWNETTSEERTKMGTKKKEGYLQAVACMYCIADTEVT